MANKAKVAKSLEMSQGIISKQKPDFPFRVLEFQSTQSADLSQSTTMIVTLQIIKWGQGQWCYN